MSSGEVLGFVETINARAEKAFWHAHLVLDDFSKNGDPDSDAILGGQLTVEQAALRVIALCARDTYRLMPQKLSSVEKKDALDDEEVTIAAIAMGRNDIGLPEKHPDAKPADEIKPLRFRAEGDFVFTSVNRNGDPEYDKKAWEDERLSYLDRCLKERANIICLGEFDYPPQQSGVDDESFATRVLVKINGYDFPVFVVAGSRHEYVKGVPSCHNVARIIVNDALNTAPAGYEKQSIYKHKKIIPAAKVGERLTAPDGIIAQYYDTKLGRIAVLICVDAYNPTLMFSLFDPKLRQRGGAGEKDSDRLDFILVPAYNFSPKLYYSCQVLSLLCKCTVLLVDACNNWSENGELKCHEVELFFNGRSIDDRLRESGEVGSSVANDEHLKIWRLKRNFLRAAETEIHSSKVIPTFSALGVYLDTL